MLAVGGYLNLYQTGENLHVTQLPTQSCKIAPWKQNLKKQKDVLRQALLISHKL